MEPGQELVILEYMVNKSLSDLFHVKYMMEVSSEYLITSHYQSEQFVTWCCEPTYYISCSLSMT